MQFESNDIYDIVAKRTGKDLEFIKALGNYVQKKLAEEMRCPRKLITSVAGIGRWYVRKGKMENAYNKFKDLDPNDYIVDSRENSKERHEIWARNLKTLKERLEDYIPFLERKADAKRRKQEWEANRANKESQNNS